MSGKKKNHTRTYALTALGVSLAACLAMLVIALFLGLNVMGWFTPDNIERWRQAFWTSLALVGIGVSVYGILMPDQVRRFLSGRQARYGSNSLVLLLAVIGVLIMVNILAFQNPVTLADLTANKEHTLAPETLQVLDTLPGKISATAYYSNRAATGQADDLLTNFKSHSNGKFDYDFKDPDTDPVTVREAGIVGDGKILLSMDGRREIAAYADETELVRAIIRLTNPGSRAVYFLSGHGEADLDGRDEFALSLVKTSLEGKNYTVNSLNLLADPEIPTDALAVIVMGPLKPISAQEVKLLEQFVENGGGLIVAEDPLPYTDFGDSPDPLAKYLDSDWGILLDNNLVIDKRNQGNELVAVTSFLSPEHPITRGMSQVAILPSARSLSQGVAPENVTLTALAQTTQESWGETDFANLEGTTITLDEATELSGPLNLAVAGTNTQTGGRVVVFGNSYFPRDVAFEKYGNSDLLINSIDWAAQQEDLLSLTPYNTTERTLKSPDAIPWLVILLFTVFLLPGMMVIAGGVSWFLRRRRG